MKYSKEFNSIIIEYNLENLFSYKLNLGIRCSVADYYMTSKLIIRLNFCYDNLDDNLKQELLIYLFDKNEILEIEILEQKRYVKGFKKSEYSIELNLNKAILTGMKTNFKGLNKWIEKKRKPVINMSLNFSEKIPAKYYALYHWILIEMGKEFDFKRDINDKYKKKDIENFAKNRYNLKNGQGFYRAFTNGSIDITKKTILSKEFGKKYKEKLIEISNDDAEFINHVRKYPN